MATKKEKITANAMKHLQKGALEKAVREFEKILEIDPNDERTLQKVGDLYARMNRTQEALSAYQRVANLYTRHGFYLKAIAVLNQILKLDPNQKDLHGKLAEMYQQLGLLNETTQQYKILHDHLLETGKTRDALDILRKIALIDRNNLPVRIRLAEGYLKEGMTGEGRDEYERLTEDLKLDNRQDEYVRVLDRILHHFPDQVDRGRELARLYLDRGETRKGLMRLKTVLKSSSNDLETLELLARAFKDLNQLAKTITVLKEIGRIHKVRNDKAALKAVWKRILEIDPENAEAKQGMSAIPFQSGVPGEAMAAVVEEEGELEELDSLSQLTMGDQSGIPKAAPQPKPPADDGVSNVLKLMTEAEVFIKYGLHDQAEERLGAVLEVEPKNVRALELLLDVYETLEDDEAADAIRQRLDSLDSDEDGEIELEPEPVADPDMSDGLPHAPLAEQTIDFEQDVELIEDDASVAADLDVADIELIDDQADVVEPDIIEEVELPEHMRNATGEAAFIDDRKPVAPPSLPQKDDIEVEDLGTASVDELLVGEMLDAADAADDQPAAAASATPLPVGLDDGPVELMPEDMSLDVDDDAGEVLDLEDVEEIDVDLGEDDGDDALEQDALELPAMPELDQMAKAAADMTPEPEVPLEGGLNLEELVGFESPADLRSDREEPEQDTELSTVDFADMVESDDDEPETIRDLDAETPLELEALDLADDAAEALESEPSEEFGEDADAFEFDSEPELIDDAEALEIEAAPELIDDAEALEIEAAPELIDDAETLEIEAAPELIDDAEALEIEAEPELIDDAEALEIEAEPELIDDAEALEIEAAPELIDDAEALEIEAAPELIDDAEALEIEAAPELLVEPDFELDAQAIEPLDDAARAELEAILSEDEIDDLEEAEFFVQQAIFGEAADLLKRLLSKHPDNAVLQARLDACLSAKKREDEQVKQTRGRLVQPPPEMASPPDPEQVATAFTSPPPLPGNGQAKDTVNLSREIMADLDDEDEAAAPSLGQGGVSVADDEIETHLNLGIAYREMGLVDEAIGEFLVAQKSGGPNLRTAIMLGLCYLQKNMADRAATFFRQGLQMPDLNLEQFMGVRYDLGAYYQENGQAAEALRQFKLLVDIDPEFRDVAKRAAQIEREKVDPAMPNSVDEVLDAVDIDALPDDYVPSEDDGDGDNISYV